MSEQLTSDGSDVKQSVSTIPALAYWHKVAIAWVVFCVVVVGLAFYIAQRPNSAVHIVSDELTDHERYKLNQLLSSFDDKSFYELKLDEIATSVTAIPWIQSVAVRRDWKQGVVIETTPRVAIANFGSEHLLDVTGTVFMPYDADLLNNPNFVNLYGDEQDAHEIMRQMEQISRWYAPLGLSIKDVILTPRRTWIIRFDTGLRVIADYDRVDEKLYQLSGILKENTLPMPIERIQAIDLRYKNGFSITDTTAVAQTQ